VSATPRQDRTDYHCDDCDAPLTYTGEQRTDERGDLQSVYTCPDPDCSTDEVLLE